MFCVQPSYEVHGRLHADFSVFYNFFLTNRSSFLIIDKLNDAAIAQSVERILGKDEVASSNLASSSRKVLKPQWFWDFFFFCDLALYHVFLHFPSN